MKQKPTEKTDDCETTDKFWDCECQYDYIHSCHVLKCQKCGAYKQDQPDSRIKEVKDTLKKEYPNELDDNIIDQLLETSTKKPCDFEELTMELGI